MKIYRTKESLLDSSMKVQIVEMFLRKMLEGIIYTTFNELYDITEEDVYDEMLDAVIELLDDCILKETAMGFLVRDSNKASLCAGLFTEETIHLAPPRSEIFYLSDKVLEMVEHNDLEDVTDYLAIQMGMGSK